MRLRSKCLCSIFLAAAVQSPMRKREHVAALETSYEGGKLFVQRNTEALSCNHCYSGKAVSIKYSECVLIELGVQHAKSMSHIIICGRLAVKYFPNFP